MSSRLFLVVGWFIAGPTVSGNLPENWQHAASAGIDAVLTDYPLELRTELRQIAN